MTDKIDALNQQLYKLNQERNELLKEEEKRDIEEFKKLEWTSNYYARLDISEFATAGLPKYYIMIPELVNSKIGTFKSTDIIFVFGDETLNYELNISYRRYDYIKKYPCFTTSSSTRLIEFLENVKFKSLDYDKTTLKVLLAAQRVSE